MSGQVGRVFAVESIDGRYHETVTPKAGQNITKLGFSALNGLTPGAEPLLPETA